MNEYNIHPNHFGTFLTFAFRKRDGLLPVKESRNSNQGITSK